MSSGFASNSFILQENRFCVLKQSNRGLKLSGLNFRNALDWKPIEQFDRDLKYFKQNHKKMKPKQFENKIHGMITKMFKLYRKRLDIYLKNVEDENNRLKAARLCGLIREILK